MRRSEMPDWAWILPVAGEDTEVVPYRYADRSGVHEGFHHKYMRSSDGTILGLHPGFKDKV